MFTQTQIKEILGDIDMDFQGQEVQIFYAEDTGLVQVGMMRPDADTGVMGQGKGGKAYISEHSTEDEIVKKILGLKLAYVAHEAREGFLYKGIRVFGPHIQLAGLMKVAHMVEGRAPLRITNG